MVGFATSFSNWKSMKNFLLKNNWFVSFKNFRITLYFLYRDFQRHFSHDFAILLKLPFYIKNQYTFFYWKSIGFCRHHFSTENQYKIFYLITVHFQPAILYWKRIQFFLLKINWFFSASFFNWKSVQNFLLNVRYF